MNLRAGIVGDAAGWSSLLNQEGIANIEAGSIFKPADFSVLVVSGSVPPQVMSAVRAFVDEGGSVLCSGAGYRELTGIRTSKHFVRYLVPELVSSFSGVGLIDLEAECDIPDDASTLRTNDGVPAISIAAIGKGHLIALPFDAAEFICDNRVKKKSFYARHGRLPFERVSQVSRAGIRKLVARAIELLHHKRNLPFVHTWYYPDGARSVFNFRIDTDDADEHEIRSLAAAVQRHGIPATWFLHVMAQEKFLGVFKELKEQELGVHCYEHRIFDDALGNANNIQKAYDVLRANGITAKGTAAPYGTWNTALASAIESLNFEYSSEFAYDYDNLPSWPFGERVFMRTLQLPVHPVSIGSLRRQGFSEEEMIEYFQNVVKQKLASRDPLFFYHHPKNGYPKVLDRMFEIVKNAGVNALTMQQFSKWWKMRSAFRPEIRFHESRLEMNALKSGLDDTIRLRVTRSDGTECFVPCSAAINLDSLEWKKTPHPESFPDDIARTRSFNPWVYVNAVEDVLSAIIRKY